MPASRVLIIRLPCHKIFPTGPLYLLSALNRGTPRPRLRMLDLALSQPADRMRLVMETAAEFRPDAIAFSWRDMQIFSPQDLDGAMRDAFVFFHDPSLLKKAGAALHGLADITVYKSSIARNIGIIRRTAACSLGAGRSRRTQHQDLRRQGPRAASGPRAGVSGRRAGDLLPVPWYPAAARPHRA